MKLFKFPHQIRVNQEIWFEADYVKLSFDYSLLLTVPNNTGTSGGDVCFS